MVRTIFLAAMLAATSARGQILVPADSRPHQPIVARLNNPIPEGAQVQGGWVLPTAVSLPAGGGAIHIWAPPGRHLISYRGIWVKTRPLTIEGVVVQVLEGFGFVDESTAFVVTQGTPPDPPVPPTPPPPDVTQLGVFVIEDGAARSGLPYGQVQAMTLPDIRQLATQFRLVDKDNPAEPIQAMAKLATSFPYLILFDLPTRKIVWQGAVPKSAAEMRTLLKNHQPKATPARAEARWMGNPSTCEVGICP